MYHSLIKIIVLPSLCGFLLAVMAVAFHCQDDALLLRCRSICQARSVASVAVSKNPVDSAPAVAVLSLGLTAILLLSTPFVHINTILLISSRTGNLFPNKAPPAGL